MFKHALLEAHQSQLLPFQHALLRVQPRLLPVQGHLLRIQHALLPIQQTSNRDCCDFNKTSTAIVANSTRIQPL
jgi:hypothetical protein